MQQLSNSAPRVETQPAPIGIDPKAAWYGVGVLFMVQIFSFMDRQALSLLIVPIKSDLGLSDTEVSLLIGLGFALAYAVAGLPIGRMVDRVSRPHLLSAGLALWSASTFMCGFARSFAQLALARSGVGVGEATGTPVVTSLIADYFPPTRRGIAFAVFAVSAYLGTGLSLIAGSAIVHALAGRAEVSLPVLGAIRSWQIVFLILGPPGVLVIPFVLSLREPRRKTTRAVAPGTDEAPRLRQVLQHYRRHWRAFVGQHAASTLMAMLFYGTGAWAPEFLRRTYDVPIASAGVAVGLTTMLAGTAGVLSGGLVSDRVLRRGQTDARLRTTVFAALCAFPFAVTFPLAGHAALALALLGGMIFFTSTISTTGSTGVQELVPPRIRGTASAVFLFVFNGIGLSFGPMLIAVLTDRLFADNAMLWAALAIAAPTMSLAAAIVGSSGLRSYRVCVAAGMSPA
ncbi:spinster family MFS transporter [Bradyrhizobium sp. HKCCYLS1011]|uniref:spinster family MFS transporter n=1 Tax=Bradyrhizobium sp. HKCCYLS1011 TaxID=3420733 RepID=UPI003EB967E5